MNLGKLRGLVFSQFRTISEFSEAIGWNRNKSSRILNGNQEPDSGDMCDLAELFSLPADMFIEIFFERKFTKCTEEQNAG